MRVVTSHIAKQIKSSVRTTLGNLHFMNDIVIIEFHEGVHVSLESSSDLIQTISKYYKKNLPFGIISNMINSYSVSPLDAQKIRSFYPNLTGYATVSYNHASRMMAEIENDFCKSEDICFENIDRAIHFLESRTDRLEIA